MSYRTKINGEQIFGNNESYDEWLNFIRGQGIEVDEDGVYDGEISDFMEMIVVLEKITMQLEEQQREKVHQMELSIKSNHIPEKDVETMRTVVGTTSMFDLRNLYEESIRNENDECAKSLFDNLLSATSDGYMFLPYTAFFLCKDKLERLPLWSIRNHANCYKIKEGEHIFVSAG